MTLARCVMVQGTASGVGKSVVATALCRVLADEGFRVAPFKAQNMSLNAAVTPDGREIGRAQAAQADAARVSARVEMNPVLLKPEADTRSQVVVLGRAAGVRSAREFWRDRAGLWPTVRSSLRTLRSEYDVVVIEGAGSPAEMNLRRGDLANMRVAAAARAAVLLVGDIERGGIFAQLLGTLALLPASDVRRIRGLVVNKFRGDPSLFTEGVRYLRRAARLPVLGVLPYDDRLDVPEEDSLALDGAGPTRTGVLDVAVVRYPHISNFDDFAPLARGGARVRYVRDASAVGTPDLLILPGSKTTMSDLEWLRERGIGSRVRALADAGVPILGICGGFQMLGTSLRDPGGVEGRPSAVRGLGLLPVSTTFRAAKRTVRVRGRLANGGALFAQADAELGGYELHVGESRRHGGAVPFTTLIRSDGRRVRDGAVSADGRVIGTYVHGLFENGSLRTALLLSLARRRGIEPPAALAPAADRYARLATWFRAAIDVPRLLGTIGVERG